MAYRLKIGPSQSLRLKGNAGFALPIIGGAGIAAAKSGGIWTVSLDYSEVQDGATVNDNTAYILTWDSASGLYTRLNITDLKVEFEGTFDGYYQPLDATLTALAALDSTSGLLVQTGADTFARRTITGTANEITVTNGAGTAGNPTLSLPSALTFTGKTVTGGSFQSPTITTPTGIVKGDVGLGNVDNTSDATKNAASATLTNKTLVSPTLTGTPTAPTASASDNSTKIATTAYVDAQVSGSISGVSSLNGQTGALALIVPPLGRLTLASGVPVMSASQASKTTVYYALYAGDIIPIYDGTNMVPTVFTELSQATTDTTKSPAAVAASKIYDLFVWNDGGTIRCTRGPAWTNATTRGYTFTMINGILLNTSSITNGPSASRGTWVGTIASNASSTIDFIFGGTGSNGVAGVFNVWNAYNRVDVGCMVVDNSAPYTYSSATIRQAHASATMQVSFVTGAQEDVVQTSYQIYVVISSGFARGGIGIDSTTVYSAYSYVLNNQVSTTLLTVNVPIGTHTITALESGDGTNSETFNQNGTANLIGLSFAFRM